MSDIMIKRILAWLFPSIGGDEFGHHTYTWGSLVGLVILLFVFSAFVVLLFPAK